MAGEFRKGIERDSGVRTSWKCRRILLFFAFFGILLFAFLRGSMPVQAADPQVLVAARANTLDGARIAKTSKGYICRQNRQTLRLRNTWVTVDGSVYYFNRKGYAQTGAFTYKGYDYYAGKDAKVYISRWHYVNSSQKYYYGKTGAMVRSSWYKIGASRYYFKENGMIARNTWIGAYYVRRNGTMVEGLKRKRNWGKIASEDGTVPKWMPSEEQKMIILGASRVVQMSAAVPSDPDVIYIAQGGAGYSWFSRCALPVLKAYLEVYPNSKVVLQFGNNDTGKDKEAYFPQYCEIYHRLIENYPSASFYFMDILPADLNRCKGKNAKARTFNTKLKKAFPERRDGGYIGGYRYLVKHGFEMTDRYHYTGRTYRVIYRYILKKVSWG